MIFPVRPAPFQQTGPVTSGDPLDFFLWIAFSIQTNCRVTSSCGTILTYAFCPEQFLPFRFCEFEFSFRHSSIVRYLFTLSIREIFTPEQAAEYLQVDKETIY